jgi:hypothetical protein
MHYRCTDAKTVGIGWDKKKPQGNGRIRAFRGKRYIMKFISETKREVTAIVGDTAGLPVHLTCRAPWKHLPTLLMCHFGFETWVFIGNNYTHSHLLGSPLGIPYVALNIWVAHGTCTKF